MSRLDRYRNLYNDINNQAGSALTVLDQPYIAAILQMFFIGYAGKFATDIGPQYQWVFEHPLARVTAFFLVAWTAGKNPAFAVTLAVAYLGALHSLKQLSEGFLAQTAIVPGCMNYTVAQLLESFGGKPEGLMQAMRVANVPFSVVIDDENAPLIATYLVNKGYPLTDPCRLPPL